MKKLYTGKVTQYDIQGNIVKIHDKVNDALSICNYDSIISCCKNKYKTAAGFVWRFENDPFNLTPPTKAPVATQKCGICGSSESVRSMAMHLKWVHQIKTDDYVTQYGEVDLDLDGGSELGGGELKTELNEAIKTIKFLKSEINEVNLLNSKLLYANKIFKSKGNLNEAQKVKVINSLDKATSTREAKLVYEALTESLNNTVKKSPLKESFSYASKPTGSTLLAKKPIIETDSSITRMQKLAGLL